MLMDNKKSNLSISSNKNSMAGENITGEEMENKNNKKYFFISLKKLFLFLITQKYTFSFICRKKLCVLGKF